MVLRNFMFYPDIKVNSCSIHDVIVLKETAFCFYGSAYSGKDSVLCTQK